MTEAIATDERTPPNPTGPRRNCIVRAAATSDAAPNAMPSMSTGTARVLLRNAKAKPLSRSPSNTDISGDVSSIGWTPTANTRPAPTSSAANRRCSHSLTAMPSRHSNTRPKPAMTTGMESRWPSEAVVAAAKESRT